MTNEEMDKEEEQICLNAHKAFKKAFDAALAAGNSVLYSENDMLFERFPDGRNVFIKNLEPSIRVEKGRKYILSSRQLRS